MNEKIKTKPKRISLKENELLEYIRRFKSEITQELELGFDKSDKEKHAFMLLTFLLDMDSEEFDDDFKDEKIKSEIAEKYAIVKKVKKSEILLINFVRTYKNELIKDLEAISTNICEPLTTKGRMLRSISGMLYRSKFSLDGLVTMGVCTEDEKEAMIKHISEHRSIVVTGCCGCGKTTLMKALLEYQDNSNIKFIEYSHELFIPNDEDRENHTVVESIGELNIKDLIHLSLNTKPSTMVISELLWGEDKLQELEFALKNMSDNTNVLATCQEIYKDYMSDKLKHYLNRKNIIEIHFRDINNFNRSRKIEYIKELYIL